MNNTSAIKHRHKAGWTYPCLVEEGGEQEAKHDDGEAIQQDQQEDEQEVGVLEHSQRKQQDRTDDGQKQHKYPVYDKPGQPVHTHISTMEHTKQSTEQAHLSLS